MAGRPVKGKVAVSTALHLIFSRGGPLTFAGVEKELIRTNGWSPSQATLYLYAARWQSGQFVEQRGKAPTAAKKLDLRSMKGKTPKAK